MVNMCATYSTVERRVGEGAKHVAIMTIAWCPNVKHWESGTYLYHQHCTKSMDNGDFDEVSSNKLCS